jgi:hypothetical protein
MTEEDINLARALIHDAGLLLSQPPDTLSEHECGTLRELVSITERLLAGTASDHDRTPGHEVLHPSTAHHYL